ncbi:hypothetical protein LOK49_LG09G00806 [Camellia lanceoleosa]|uniref:Uncharacterized protein n=1 Tax=Camellia lanceoleosa TaxID=1840588 RepID=A0ACC0GFD4_9ERIC|nr:hypothetical protein LOK49_LG09G00806 [Camellia lanceoleosa]
MADLRTYETIATKRVLIWKALDVVSARLYFKDEFALEDGDTFRTACPFSTLSENLVLQEKLSQYLDVVELHLCSGSMHLLGASVCLLRESVLCYGLHNDLVLLCYKCSVLGCSVLGYSEPCVESMKDGCCYVSILWSCFLVCYGNWSVMEIYFGRSAVLLQ